MVMRLSQTQLTLLGACPRRFQYSFLEHLSVPPQEAQQASIDWGNRFHLLMQQAQLGLPLDRLLQADEPLAKAVKALRHSQPALLEPPSPGQCESEHLRTFCLAGQSFSVVYDLLITDGQQAQILDWKTYPKPRDRRTLAQSWQTKLYCYGLVVTSDYAPDQVSMTYWFVRGKDPDAAPEQISLRYNQSWHDQIHQDLTRQIEQLDRWLADYGQGQPLPQAPIAAGHCDRCPFLERCRGRGAWRDRASTALDLGAIAEVVP